MLRSLQTTNPEEAWGRIHVTLAEYASGVRIPGEVMQNVLPVHCRGMKAQKDTLNWALSHSLIRDHREMIPTGYSRTDKGCSWQPLGLMSPKEEKYDAE